MTTLMLVVILCVQLTQMLVVLFLWRMFMSKTADLTAAVDKVLAYISSLQNAPVTQDSEVQAQVDRLNAAVPQPQP